ncbi:TetR/AcrR family transcriptional regulator C-terminal domain-containing protein [Streptosporangium sp. NPDC051023]|uniref:TetR/AcrR family transcriptional regulator n=1 Tax=Streptosporangium sp. NPDC051023 TaxID=3155410 RepID=UPI00344FB109
MTRGKAKDPDRGVRLLWGETEHDPRPGLSLVRIVRAAIELADEEGLAGLSMRKVAERLGFTTMSLYRHIPGRDQLVDLMRDEVMGERPAAPAAAGRAAGEPVPSEEPLGESGEHVADERAGRVRAEPSGGGWRARLETCAREGWELRRRHPWLAEVRGTRHIPGPNVIAHYEYMLSVVADTGLPPGEVIAVVGLIGRFVDAEALLLVEVAQAERHSGVSEQEWWGTQGSLFERLDRYPTLSRLWEAGGWDHPEDSFEFGLARLLDGVELLIQQRDETRDENALCKECGTPVDRAPSGRPRAYCSRACQQRAYRKRRSP